MIYLAFLPRIILSFSTKELSGYLNEHFKLSSESAELQAAQTSPFRLDLISI